MQKGNKTVFSTKPAKSIKEKEDQLEEPVESLFPEDLT